MTIDSGRDLSTNAKAAVFAAQTKEVFIILATIDHPNFDQPFRVASDPYELLPDAGVRGVVSRGNEYIYLPFSITLPQEDETGVSRATLKVDNIDRRVVAAVRQANSAISVTLEIVLSSDVDIVEMSIEDFRLQQVTYDAFTVSGDISVEYFDLEPFPSGRFTPSFFPGLF